MGETLKARLAVEHPSTGARPADSSEAADQFNVENIERQVESLTGRQLLGAAVEAELDALTDRQERRFLAIVALGEIPVADARIRAIVAGIFGPETDTRANILDLQTETVSEATFYGMTYVLPGHIEDARR